MRLLCQRDAHQPASPLRRPLNAASRPRTRHGRAQATAACLPQLRQLTHRPTFHGEEPRNLLNTALYLHICPQPMLLQHPPALPYQPDSAPAHLSVVPLPYPRPESFRGQQCAEARLHAEGCCAAAQSPRRQVSSPRSRHGLPSAADTTTRARVAPPSRRPPWSWPSRMSGHRPRRPSRCPHLLSAMRTAVRPTGRADVRCPRVRCPGVRCPRDRCDAGVRTDRRPLSAAAASGLSAPRWIRERVGAAGPARLGAPGSTGRRGR
jgi:hypothetical protein